MLNIPEEDSLTEDEIDLGSETDNTYNIDEHSSESTDDIIDESAADIKEDDLVDISEEDILGYNIHEETQENVKAGYTKKSFVKGLIYDLIFYAAIVFICLYIIPNFVLQRTVVDGPSMMNTLLDKDQLYVEKLSYHFNALKRFDIIVFYPKGRSNDDYYVKRIIGLPGEKVQIIGENIYINDELLEEDYGLEPIQNPGRAAAPVYLADDEYFVMGDNRNVSKDSRSTEVGNVKRANIGGRVILRIYPFDRFGLVD
jgi:signal peptidase I